MCRGRSLAPLDVQETSLGSGGIDQLVDRDVGIDFSRLETRASVIGLAYPEVSVIRQLRDQAVREAFGEWTRTDPLSA